MTTLLSILYSITGASTAPAAIRRAIGMIIGAVFMVYVGIRSTLFLKDFSDKTERTVEVQEKTLSQLENISNKVEDLEDKTATKGDIKMLDLRMNELDSTLIRTSENQKKLFWRLDYSIRHKNDTFIDILQEFKRRDEFEYLNRKLEPVEPDLTTYIHGKEKRQ